MPSGNPIACSFHDAPKSSELKICGPVQLNEAPANSRVVPPLVSTMQE